MDNKNYFKENNILTTQDLLEYMNEYIIYGWKDMNGELHDSSLKDFRKLYVTSSNEESIKNGNGTCIEQTLLEKAFMDEMGITCKLYSLRDYRIRDDNELDIKMHCFLLYFMNDKCYHFEHANAAMRGIYEYNTEEDAMEILTEYYKKRSEGHERTLNEFLEIPCGLTFKEVNNYLDNLNIKKR